MRINKEIKTVATVCVTFSMSVFLMGCGGSKAYKEAKSVEPLSMENMAESAEPAFQKIDSQMGDGAMAVAGQTVSVHYTGWLYDAAAADNRGKKFDSSVDRGRPFSFPLGGGRVIKGWDEGVAGMKIGGKRTLIIPSDMGYGLRGAGSDIPPNATLVFDVELLGIQ